MNTVQENTVYNGLITNSFKMRKPRIPETSKSKTDSASGSSCSRSDDTESGKHCLTTPRKRCLKNVKRGSRDDVHSKTSPRTPKATQERKTPSSSPRTPKGTPRSGWFLSQEPHGDVTWDYTSPKRQLNSVKKRAEKSTVAELLKGLKNDKLTSLCQSQASGMVSLVEKWMAGDSKQLFTGDQDFNEGLTSKRLNSSSRAGKVLGVSKKIRELLQVIKSDGHIEASHIKDRVPGSLNNKSENVDDLVEDRNLPEKIVQSILNKEFCKKPLNNSLELWDENSSDSDTFVALNSVTLMPDDILETCAINTSNLCIKDLTQNCDSSISFPSFIPETAASAKDINTVQNEKKLTCLRSKTSQSKLDFKINDLIGTSCNRTLKQASASVTSLSHCDYSVTNSNNETFVCDDDLWEDSSSVDEILCSIPEEALLNSTQYVSNYNSCDIRNHEIENKEKKVTSKVLKAGNSNKQTKYLGNSINKSRWHEVSPKFKMSQKCSKKNSEPHMKLSRNSSYNEKKSLNLSKSSPNTGKEHDSIMTARTSFNLKVPQVTLQDSKFNSTDGSKSNDTEDIDSTLLQPEVLHWLDQIESQAFGSQRCTPEEIAQKREDAIKRRQKKNQQLLVRRDQNLHTAK